MTEPVESKPIESKVELVDILDGIKPVTIYDGTCRITLVDCMPRLVRPGENMSTMIAQTARTSYGRRVGKTIEDDRRLAARLWRDRHTSPIEMPELQFLIEGIPLFVHAQLKRHRMASLNEQSGRYTKFLERMFYPALRMQSAVNKQGSSDAPVPEAAQMIYTACIERNAANFRDYERLIELGIAKEVARCVLPQSLTTTIVWKQDLHNLTHMLRLRMAPDAQLEIRQLAHAMCELTRQVAPDIVWLMEQEQSARALMGALPDSTKVPGSNVIGSSLMAYYMHRAMVVSPFSSYFTTEVLTEADAAALLAKVRTKV